MVDLQSCYFCNTTGDVQEYAVVPAQGTAGGDSQRTAALCGQCKTKLKQVIEPLTDRLDAEDASPGGGSSVSDEPGPTTAARRTDAGSGGSDTEAGETAAESGVSATGSGETTAESGVRGSDGPTTDERSVQHSDPAAAEDAGAGSTGGGGTATTGGPDGKTGSKEGPDSDAGSRTDGSSTPPNYRRAMRMLSNRVFPIDRAEVESMLAGAYDLERHEIAAVLEHALDTGRLVEEDGQFQEP